MNIKHYQHRQNVICESNTRRSSTSPLAMSNITGLWGAARHTRARDTHCDSICHAQRFRYKNLKCIELLEANSYIAGWTSVKDYRVVVLVCPHAPLHAVPDSGEGRQEPHMPSHARPDGGEGRRAPHAPPHVGPGDGESRCSPHASPHAGPDGGKSRRTPQLM